MYFVGLDYFIIKPDHSFVLLLLQMKITSVNFLVRANVITIAKNCYIV